MICKHILLITFLNKPRIILLLLPDIQDTQSVGGGFLPFCKDAVSIFYCHSRLGFQIELFKHSTVFKQMTDAKLNYSILETI